MSRTAVHLTTWMFLLASMIFFMPSIHDVQAKATASIETPLFSHSFFVPPREVRAPHIILPSGTNVRIIYNASETIDFFCQNSREYNQSSLNRWLNVSYHWSEKTATMNQTYIIPTTSEWYFTLVNYEYHAIDVYIIGLYEINMYEIHVETNKENYSIAEEANITSSISKNGRPATGLTVTLQISDQNGTVIQSQNKQTNAQGQAVATFTLPDKEGQYHATARTTISEVTIEHSVIFAITKDTVPPITVADYNGSWFTANSTIKLTAIDDETGVMETYYRINNGSTLKVSSNGQPQITTEGANNTLEYWSIDNAGNEETSHNVLTGIKLDKTPPGGSMLINGNATYTNSTSVTLTLLANDTTSGVYQIRLSNDSVWDTEPWQEPSPTKNWALSAGDGTKTVYYQVKDTAGLVSNTYSDSIVLDTTPPTGSIIIHDGANYTTTTTVTLTLSAADTTSSVAEMRFSNDNITYTKWQPYTTFETWKLEEPDGPKTVYVQFKDYLGLISTHSDTIVLDTVQPTGLLIINRGANYTNSTFVALTLYANDATSGAADMRFSNNDMTWSNWEAYTGSKLWNLTSGDGAKSVAVQYRDNAGLISSYSDSIILDTTKPTAIASANQTVYEDSPVTFDASASIDESSIANYSWTFTDMTAKILTGEKATYAFTTPGVYTITLKATDPAGNSATDKTTITVVKISRPIANAGQNQTVNVGAIVTFNASASSDEVGIVHYGWDFGDGAPGTGETTTHIYSNPGTYVVTLTVENASGNIDTDQITIAVSPEGTPTWIVSTIVAALAVATFILTIFIWKKRTVTAHTLSSSPKV